MPPKVLRNAGYWDLLLCIFKFRRLVVIEGSSMLPTIKNGDTVIVNLRAYKKTEALPGDLVYIRHPFKTDVRIIKRVHSKVNGLLELRGDNPDSLSTTDSRSFGRVSDTLLYGQVIARLY